MERPGVRIHPSAQVSDEAHIGQGTQVWLHCQIRERVRIGEQCILGKNVYVESDVAIGNCVKIQNNVSIYVGVEIEDGAFIGPHVCFTNDLYPRAVNPDGTLKNADDWTVTRTTIRRGASLGANSTIVCGHEVGEWALVAAGSVVTRDVPAHALVRGNPAKVVGYVCRCAKRIEAGEQGSCECMASDSALLKQLRERVQKLEL